MSTFAKNLSFFFAVFHLLVVFCFSLLYICLLQVPAAAMEGSATETPAAPAPEASRGRHDVKQEHLAFQVGGNLKLWIVLGGGGAARRGEVTHILLHASAV